MIRPLVFAGLAVSILCFACSDDESSSSSSSGGSSGSTSSSSGSTSSSSGSTSTSSGSTSTTKFSCSLNGSCYKCPTSEAVGKCATESPSAAGCTSTDSSFCE